MAALPQRFWDKVDKSGDCWLWTASTNKRGYGQFMTKRPGNRFAPVLAHRLAYENQYGSIAKGLCVCHKCDVPACVNPDHLFVGTRKDNNIDRDKKNRVRHGESHPCAKLTARDVASIPELRKRGLTLNKIGKRFGVCHSTISMILSGKLWARTVNQRGA